jgi:hypothetical protein
VKTAAPGLGHFDSAGELLVENTLAVTDFVEDLSIDVNGYLYVAWSEAAEIEKFDRDVETSLGSWGSGFQGRPVGITFPREGTPFAYVLTVYDETGPVSWQVEAVDEDGEVLSYEILETNPAGPIGGFDVRQIHRRTQEQDYCPNRRVYSCAARHGSLTSGRRQPCFLERSAWLGQVRIASVKPELPDSVILSRTGLSEFSCVGTP